MTSRNLYARYGFKPSDRMMQVYEAANQRLARERGVVYAAAAGRFLESKVHLRDLLRDAGLPKAAAEKIARAGWPALSPDNARAEAAARIRQAAARLRR